MCEHEAGVFIPEVWLLSKERQLDYSPTRTHIFDRPIFHMYCNNLVSRLIVSHWLQLARSSGSLVLACLLAASGTGPRCLNIEYATVIVRRRGYYRVQDTRSTRGFTVFKWYYMI